MKNVGSEHLPFPKRGVYLHDGFTFEPKKICPFYWTLQDWSEYVDWLNYLGLNVVEFAIQLSFLREANHRV